MIHYTPSGNVKNFGNYRLGNASTFNIVLEVKLDDFEKLPPAIIGLQQLK